MRKIRLLMIIATMSVALLAGCGGKKAEEPNTTTPPKVEDKVSEKGSANQGSPNQGITVNKIQFETVDEAKLTEDMKQTIQELKAERGYLFWKDGAGYTVYISSGEKSSGGFGIEVKSVEDNEGKTVIIVEETEPAKDAIVTMALTYPYTLIKIEGVTDQFVVENTKGIGFEKLDAENIQDSTKKSIMIEERKVEATYVGQIDGNSIEVMVDGKPSAFRTEKVQDQIANIKQNDKVEITYTENEYGQQIIETIKVIS